MRRLSAPNRPVPRGPKDVFRWRRWSVRIDHFFVMCAAERGYPVGTAPREKVVEDSQKDLISNECADSAIIPEHLAPRPEIFSLPRPNNQAQHSLRQTFRTAPPVGLVV